MNPGFKYFGHKRLLSSGIGVSFLSISLLSGCSLVSFIYNPDSSIKEGLKLGSVLPSTGELSLTGQDMLQAVQLAVEEVNACGGVNGQPVIHISKDSKSEPAAGATAMTRLAEEEQVAGIIGARASSVSDAMVDVAVRNQVMMISPSSTSPNFTARAKNGDFQGYWARTVPSDVYQAQALAKLAHQRDIQTLSTLAVNDRYGIGFERQLVNAFTKLGGTVLGDINPVRYDLQGDNFDTETDAVLANKPDAVTAILYPQQGTTVLQSAYKRGLDPEVKLLLTDAVYSKNFVKRVGKTAEGKWILSGALGTVAGNNPDALSKFAAQWQERTGAPVSTYFPHTWDATLLLILAAEAANTNTGQGIKSKLREVANPPGTEVTEPCEALKSIRKGREIDYQGVSGNVDIDRNGDVIADYNIWKVNDDGTLAIIERVNPLTEAERAFE